MRNLHWRWALTTGAAFAMSGMLAAQSPATNPGQSRAGSGNGSSAPEAVTATGCLTRTPATNGGSGASSS